MGRWVHRALIGAALLACASHVPCAEQADASVSSPSVIAQQLLQAGSPGELARSSLTAGLFGEVARRLKFRAGMFEPEERSVLWFAIARHYYRVGPLEEAAKALGRIESFSASAPADEVHLLAGMIRMHQGQWVAANAAFARIPRRSPLHGLARYNDALASINLGLWEGGMKVLDELGRPLETEQAEVRAVADLANLTFGYLVLQRQHYATRRAQVPVTSVARLLERRTYLSFSNVRTEDSAAALEHLQRVSSEEPYYAAAVLGRIWLAMQRGGRKTALEASLSLDGRPISDLASREVNSLAAYLLRRGAMRRWLNTIDGPAKPWGANRQS